MNQDWNNSFNDFKSHISKKDSFNIGIKELLDLRKDMLDQLLLVKNSFPNEGYSLMPFINSKGYENKTMAYSIYHLARIEDIVLNTLILDKEQIFFKDNYQRRLNSKIITTGNELIKEEIGEFSKDLNIDELFNYYIDVYNAGNEYIKSLVVTDLKKSIEIDNVNKLIKLNVAPDFLIDYWGNKNILGLLLMPFSRHHIMHINALIRIENKIIKNLK